MPSTNNRKRQNLFQGLAAALFGILAAYLLQALLQKLTQGFTTLWPMFLVVAIPIAVVATRLPLWGATAFFGVTLACGISLLFLWIAHMVTNRSDTEYMYADLVAYGGIIFSAYVLIGLLLAIDSRKRAIRRGLAAWIFASAAAMLCASSVYVHAHGEAFLFYITILFFVAPCCLHILAIWTTNEVTSEDLTIHHDREPQTP